ncbi:MAG: Lrp/AsnC family transcriptional regulator [Thermoplasmata archaeon]
MIVINKLKKGIGINDDPYGEFAKNLNMDKKEFIEYLHDMKNTGKILKMRALLSHSKLGYKVNAMIAMKDVHNIDFFIGMPNISHFYIRESNEKFPYNFYAMAHFRDENELKKFSDILDDMHIEYEILRTIRNLKRIEI